MKQNNVKKVTQRIWPMANWLTNHESHPYGGIMIAWESNLLQINKLAEGEQFIHLEMIDNGRPRLLVTAIYGSNDDNQRTKLWDSLRQLCKHNDAPWVVAGDLNAVRIAGDRQGRSMLHGGFSQFWTLTCLN